MICPHCHQSVRLRERTDRRCSKCRKPFAFEPKASPLRLHDLRVQKLAQRLSDEGKLRYTPMQLWYAAGRKVLRPPRPAFNRARFFVSLAIAGVVFVATMSGVVVAGTRSGMPAGTAFFLAAVVAFLIAAAALVFVIVALLAVWPQPRIRRMKPIRIPVDYNVFQHEVARRWASVYGGPPPGWVDERTPSPPASVSHPRSALLCPDRSVLACLAANDVAGNRAMVLAERIEQLPPGVPVIVLHDASVPGLLFADHARAQLGPRAVVAGLAPRAVLASKSLLRLCEGLQPQEGLARLQRGSLSQAEIDWLTEGFWSPIAAIPPAKLLAALDRSVGRTEEMADPDRRQARAIGFLTWPTR